MMLLKKREFVQILKLVYFLNILICVLKTGISISSGYFGLFNTPDIGGHNGNNRGIFSK